MGAVVVFVARNERGNKILDDLEAKSGVLPFKRTATERSYNPDAPNAGVDGFDEMLGTFADDWPEHLSRTLDPELVDDEVRRLLNEAGRDVDEGR